MTGLALRTELGACFRRGVSMARTVLQWGRCTILFAWPRFQFGISAGWGFAHDTKQDKFLASQLNVEQWVRLCACIICHICHDVFISTPHLPVKHVAPIRPQMVPSTWCNWIPRPWPWYHGCIDVCFQCPVDFSWIPVDSTCWNVAKEKKKAVTCMGYEVQGMNELEFVEERCTWVSIFFSVGTCVSGIRKRDHQDGERLDLLKTAMRMIVHEKCPKIYSMRAY